MEVEIEVVFFSCCSCCYRSPCIYDSAHSVSVSVNLTQDFRNCPLLPPFPVSLPPLLPSLLLLSFTLSTPPLFHSLSTLFHSLSKSSLSLFAPPLFNSLSTPSLSNQNIFQIDLIQSFNSHYHLHKSD